MREEEEDRPPLYRIVNDDSPQQRIQYFDKKLTLVPALIKLVINNFQIYYSCSDICLLVCAIDQLYTQMGKVVRLCNTVEFILLLPCFGLSALYLLTPDPACRPGITAPLYTRVE